MYTTLDHRKNARERSHLNNTAQSCLPCYQSWWMYHLVQDSLLLLWYSTFSSPGLPCRRCLSCSWYNCPWCDTPTHITPPLDTATYRNPPHWTHPCPRHNWPHPCSRHNWTHPCPRHNRSAGLLLLPSSAHSPIRMLRLEYMDMIIAQYWEISGITYHDDE